MNILMKNSTLKYILLVILALIFPLSYYPHIYGSDPFQIIWMANAIKKGAMFSENTWLISPLSYFGYYPFSHRAIGVPIFLAFLISLLEFLSFGIFGITEAVLMFNIIFVIILYKCSRDLSNRLFEEEWSRFVFIAAILLSPYIISEIAMTVSTRIIITIIMVILLNLNLKILNNDSINKFKITIYLFLSLLIGALAHRLWMGTIITIIITLFMIFIRKFKKIRHLIIFLILPLSIIAFFFGLTIFNIDSGKIWSPFFDNSTLIGILINLIIDFMLKAGLIALFFPVGVIASVWKLTIFLKTANDDKNVNLRKKENNYYIRNVYLLVFILPFSFMAPSFYAIVIFLPILIIFSVQGLIIVKNIISTISNKLNWFFPLFILFISMGYSFLYVEIYININLWYTIILMSIYLFFYLFIIILNKFHHFFHSKISFNSFKLCNWLFISVIIISTLIFTTTTVVGRKTAANSYPYPWDNDYLTNEEIEIIGYFQKEEIDGLIFCAVGRFISERIAGFGFLPAFFDRTIDGKALYYGFTSPNEVYKYTVFSLYGLSNLTFFRFTGGNPIRTFKNSIINLNVSLKGDFEILQSYNVQYIISDQTCDKSFSGDGKIMTLIKSLPSTFSPVFSTPNLLIWKLF